jgi:hypothetical protein
MENQTDRKVYWVDIPVWPTDENEGAFRNVGTFTSKKKARESLLKTWGIKPRFSEIFITEGQL